MGESDATLMARAVIGEGKKGAIGDRYVRVRSSVDRSTFNGWKLLDGRRRLSGEVTAGPDEPVEPMKKTHRGKKPNPAIVKTSEEEGDETKVKGQNRGAGRFGTRSRDH
jgi:hypothetical protein